ncbi:Mor transcription activator family protein [Neisseria perflava]|uniref:Mor transcription activator family protein n=1 Tax=Neisseria perflava TaxID=33053 RepID=UPI00209F3681|nr:Mor transcription activator family protein [Neisseria perflava]MCP1659319.1 Mor family transcriptional regulator [Neisseria perflava]MCP1772877.1 Mor family transcriptional regulator [Neisseria perflava]
MKWELTENDLRDLGHLLPESAHSLITVVGLANAFTLIKRWGGTHFPLSTTKRKRSAAGQALHDALAHEIGEEAACRLEEAYCGQRHVLIPRCKEVMLELQKRAIRREYDEMTGRDVIPMSDGMAVRLLALKYHITERWVRYILAEADKTAAPAVQTALF